MATLRTRMEYRMNPCVCCSLIPTEGDLEERAVLWKFIMLDTNRNNVIFQYKMKKFLSI